MASYDKEKLLRMMEEQRRSFSVQRDLGDRIQDCHRDITAKQAYLRRCASSSGATDYFEDTLVQLSLEDALALPQERVTTVKRAKYGLQSTTYEQHSTGISFGDWQELNHERARMERLRTEMDRYSKLHGERFACTQKLIEAVKDWGFRDPADEL